MTPLVKSIDRGWGRGYNAGVNVAAGSPQPVTPSDHPREECGVVGVYAPGGDASRIAFFGLFSLQHRGQESAGIAASDGRSIEVHTDMGLVTQIYREEELQRLRANWP